MKLILIHLHIYIQNNNNGGLMLYSASLSGRQISAPQVGFFPFFVYYSYVSYIV